VVAVIQKLIQQAEHRTDGVNPATTDRRQVDRQALAVPLGDPPHIEVRWAGCV
jgi:hypothetical protein